MKISVSERGYKDIDKGTFAHLAGHPTFDHLVEHNVIAIEARPRGQFRISAFGRVGRALVGGSLIEVTPKFEGALAKLLSFGSARHVHLSTSPSPLTDADASSVYLATLLVRAAKEYLSGPVEPCYMTRRESGSMISGRLDILGTIGLRARGRQHQAVFDRPYISQDTPVLRVIYAALREVERLATLHTLPDGLVVAARGLRLGLSECEASTVFLARHELRTLGKSVVSSLAINDPAADVARLAAAVLDSAGFGGSTKGKGDLPHSWFINLELLFEDAVLASAARRSPPHVSVSRALNRPLVFPAMSSLYRANPDLVFSANGTTFAVADAKYKDIGSLPAPRDLYQLLAHASGYGVRTGILFHPADRGGIQDLGIASTGCRVFVAGVGFDTLADDVEAAMATAFPEAMARAA